MSNLQVCNTLLNTESFFNMPKMETSSFIGELLKTDSYNPQNGVCYIIKEEYFMRHQYDSGVFDVNSKYPSLEIENQICALKNLFVKLNFTQFVEYELPCLPSSTRHELKFELRTELLSNATKYDGFAFLLFIHNNSDSGKFI